MKALNKFVIMLLELHHFFWPLRIYVISVVVKTYLEESLGLLKRKYIKSCSWQRQDQSRKKGIVPLVLLKEHCICTLILEILSNTLL